MSLPASKYRVENHSVPVDNGTAEIVVRTIAPSAGPRGDQKFPILYWMHGGGKPGYRRFKYT